MSSLSRLAATALGLFAVAMACTNDYDEFQFTGSPDGAAGTGPSTGGTTAGTSGSGGSGNIGALGGTSGTGGTGGNTTGGSAGTTGGVGGGTGGTGVTCPAGEKFCSTTSACVPDNDVATNCASADCTPCDLANATEQCATTGECAVLACDQGFSNCDRNATNGCEQTFDDPAHCGACGRACSTTNSISQDCTITSGVSVCQHTCATDFSDCVKQSYPSGDDGCETNTSSNATRCGSCSNDCTANLVCVSGRCGCSADANCTNGSASGTCSNNVCVCGGTTCATGETCARSGGNNVCRCNGGTPCTGGRICCQSPSGCFDINTDESNCGGCGRVCGTGTSCCGGTCLDTSADESNCGGCGTTCSGSQLCCSSSCVDTSSDEANCGGCGTACSSGQTCCGGSCVNTGTDASNCGGCGTVCVAGLTCSAGLCACTSDAACNGGTPGTCSGGLCTCGDGGVQCAQNQRCVVSDVCGT